MSESVSDLDWWAATRYPSVHDDWRPSPSSTGRHAINEDAAETPIFHALSTGAWRSREPAAPPARPAQPPRGAQRRPVRERPAQERTAQERTAYERGGYGRPAHDPVEAFHRDPLTMPIPKQVEASTEAARRAAFGAHAQRPDRAQPERPRQPRRERQPERSWGAQARESRYPESSPYPARRESVSDSGRHHHRRPSISSLL